MKEINECDIFGKLESQTKQRLTLDECIFLFEVMKSERRERRNYMNQLDSLQTERDLLQQKNNALESFIRDLIFNDYRYQ